ncbi:hypothetical protein F5B20DRAFT_578953 [Whalleya microplaca]|nr:hypothetical protein F5B20DRAFT_578953 [Whalleya microplaca]
MDDDGRQIDRDALDNTVRNGNDHYIRPADLAKEGGDLNKDSQSVQIYVSAPCTFFEDENGDKNCDTDSNNEPVWMYSRIGALLNTLFGPGTPFEGLTIYKRGYIKPSSNEEAAALRLTSRGKVLVQYDNNQRNDEFQEHNPKHAIYRVWLENQPYQHEWVASDVQGGNAGQ